jgi:hypothetical protein
MVDAVFGFSIASTSVRTQSRIDQTIFGAFTNRVETYARLYYSSFGSWQKISKSRSSI